MTKPFPTDVESLCHEGARLYAEYLEIKGMRTHGVWYLLKLADQDDAWEDYQAHVKECEICKVVER